MALLLEQSQDVKQAIEDVAEAVENRVTPTQLLNLRSALHAHDFRCEVQQ